MDKSARCESSKESPISILVSKEPYYVKNSDGVRIIEAPVELSFQLLQDLLSRCELNDADGNRIANIADLKKNTWITTFAQYQRPGSAVIELHVDGPDEYKGKPAVAWLSSSECAYLVKEMKAACGTEIKKFRDMKNELSAPEK